MGLSFYDPRTGTTRDFRPAAPPAVGVDAAGAGPRERALADSLRDALSFLGLKAAAGAEIRVGGADPGPGAAWLTAPPAEEGFDAAAIASRGYAAADFHFLCLKTHYRKPLELTWDALAAARAERADLSAIARSLAGVTLEPSSRGKAGYLHRFREVLSKDLDYPSALGCVWDGLRPGALSPGSRAALLRETFPALHLAASDSAAPPL